MSEVTFFKLRNELNSQKNLDDFIDHCQNKLTLYEDQGGYSVDTWRYDSGRKKHAMVFSKYTENNNPYSFEPFSEPFMSFAKSYIRYRQTEQQVTSIGDKMVILRMLYDALIEIHDEANVLKTDGLVQSEITALLNARFPKSDKLFRYGGQLVLLYKFLIGRNITPTLPDWTNRWKRGKSKAERTDDESQAWQQVRCPSQHQMLALADCFAKAKTSQDKYWSSALSLLMFAPSRAGELTFLTTDSLHEDGGRLGVRWYGQKGFEFTVKWVPETLEKMVRLAFERLIEIGKPAREAAKFAHDNPGKFMHHDRCITPLEFPINQPLNAVEFAYAMGFASSTIKRLKAKTEYYDNTTGWNFLNADSSKWIQELRSNGNPTYQHLAQFTLNKYKTKSWPNLPKTGRPVWEALLLIRENEFHKDFLPRNFSWILPDVNQLNDQLSQRALKNLKPTIFQRFEIKDEDGTEIEMTSHQLRVWLSTNAERGGMDAWRLAQWAGRARIADNRHYDLRTQEEREQQANALLKLDHRPTALEAIKLKQPVAYVNLGLNRIGIADITEYGFCTHDYAMTPCTKAGQCMTCKEHACMKGMPKTLERIKLLEERLDSQFQKAKGDAEQNVFGADRWETHLGWKLAHVRTQRKRLESDDLPDGTIIWIPPEHDASPIERSLQQRGYETQTSKEELVDDSFMKSLLGVDYA
jgi:hypothetical protein